MTYIFIYRSILVNYHENSVPSLRGQLSVQQVAGAVDDVR